MGFGVYPEWVGLLLGIVVTAVATVALTVPIEGTRAGEEGAGTAAASPDTFDKLDPISRVFFAVKGFLPEILCGGGGGWGGNDSSPFVPLQEEQDGWADKEVVDHIHSDGNGHGGVAEVSVNGAL